MLTVSRINFNQSPNLIKRKTNNMCQPLKFDTVSFRSLPPHLPSNFGEVVEGKLYRGALPSTELQLSALMQKGIKTIISLLEPNANSTEKQMVEKMGMRFVDLNLPQQQSIPYFKKLPEALEKMKSLLEEGPVFVHCEHGRARTGNLIAAYQKVVLGMDNSNIINQGKKYGSNSLDLFLNLFKAMKEDL